MVDIKKPPYSTHYPELANWIDPIDESGMCKGAIPAGNVMENNVVYRCGEKLKLTGPKPQFDDINNFETQEAPGFVDAENMNFQLRDDSIVYKKIPGFKRIPFEKIGLYKDKYRNDIGKK